MAKISKPLITDHAVLRYMERVMGLDVEALRKRMWGKEVADAIKIGALSVTVDGVKYVIEGGRVVTVHCNEALRGYKAKKKPERADIVTRSGLP